MAVNEMEGVPVSDLERWTCTKQVGKGREGLLPPLPQGPARQGPSNLAALFPRGLELLPASACPPDWGKAGFMYY